MKNDSIEFIIIRIILYLPIFFISKKFQKIHSTSYEKLIIVYNILLFHLYFPFHRLKIVAETFLLSL